MNLKEQHIFKYKTGLNPYKSHNLDGKKEDNKRDFSLNKENNFNSLFDIGPRSKLQIKQRNNSNTKRLKSSKLQTENNQLRNRIEISDNLKYNKTIKEREIEKTIEDKNNLNNISVYSTQCANDEKVPRFQKTYYFLNNNEQEKRRRELLKTSYHFNKYNNDRAIIRMINRFKNKEELDKAQREYNKKYNQFSYTKRIHTKIAFGKGTPNEIPEIDNNYNFNKKRKQQRIKRKKNSEELKDLFNNGYKLKINDKIITDSSNNNGKENKKQIFITNSNIEKFIPKDSFGYEIYPVLTKHKILKNILPNEVDYNTKTSINDIVNSEIHPLLRYQKKIMSQSSNLISQELNVLFSKFISLSKINSDENNLRRNDILIELKKEEKFIRLMRGLIGKDKEIEKLLQEKINEEEKKKKMIRRKYLLKKFKEVMLIAHQKIKKYNIDIDIFYSLMSIDKNEENFQKEYINKGQYLFRVIKAGDVDEIINVVNDNSYLVSYKDEFDQLPLHICAKRNLYQIIAFLLSRLSPIDAQD